MRDRLPIILLLLVTLVSACENYQSNFDKEIKICEVAEQHGILETAVEACTAALDIAVSQDFSPALKSRTLYALGRLKRQQGHFKEAEELLTQSLAIEEQQENTSNQEIGRRLLELSLSMAGQNQWLEGSQALRRLLPVIDQLSEQERRAAAHILKRYASQLKQADQPELAVEFETSAIELLQEKS